MTPKIQPEFHPGADTLSAFAERTLPQNERARVLAHIAECARCREVLYLAQAAIEQDIAPAAGKEGAQRGWIASAFVKWRVALIPAAALATVGGIVLWVQMQPAAPRTEMAQLIAPQAPAEPAAPPRTRTAARTDHPNQAPVAPTAASSVARENKNPQGAVSGRAAREEMAQNKPTPRARVAVGEAQTYHAPPLDARSASMAIQAPQPAALNAHAPTAFSHSLVQPRWQQQAADAARPASTALNVEPPPPPPNLISVHSAAMVPATVGPELTDAQPVQNLALTPQALNNIASFRLVNRAKLPSGLNVVSSATLLNRLVALDSAGSVFLSKDGGIHWEPVRAQWAGKAIAVQAPSEGLFRVSALAAARPSQPVRLASQAPAERNQDESVKLSPPPTGAGAQASEQVPSMQFTLVTDRHQTWVSADGKLWREQHARRPATP